MRAPTIRHHATAISAVLLALLVAAPASAQGDRCQAPPGRSALEQYCEQLPGAGGSQGGGGGGGVDRKTARELRSAGGAGAALLGLAESSGGGTGSNGGGSGSGGSGRSEGGGSGAGASGSGSSDTGDADAEPSGSVLSALTSSAEDGPTVGNALAWVLIAIAIGCFAVAWLAWRRRRGDQPDSSA
jgi:hypothetical protein